MAQDPPPENCWLQDLKGIFVCHTMAKTCQNIDGHSLERLYVYYIYIYMCVCVCVVFRVLAQLYCPW